MVAQIFGDGTASGQSRGQRRELPRTCHASFIDSQSNTFTARYLWKHSLSAWMLSSRGVELGGELSFG